MPYVLADRVKETTTTTGTGSLTLLGAVDATFRTFLAGLGNGTKTLYGVVSGDALKWEVGEGTVVGSTLTRDRVLASSTGVLVNLQGVSTVACVAPANRALPNVSDNVDANLLIANYNTGALSAGPVVVSSGLVFWGPDGLNANHQISGFGTGAGAPGIILTRGRGTMAVPAGVQVNDGIGFFTGVGTSFDSVNNVSYVNDLKGGASISFVASEAWLAPNGVSTAEGGEMSFQTTANGTGGTGARKTRMRISNDGGIVVQGAASTDPTGGSQGVGTINVAGGFYVNGTAIAVPSWVTDTPTPTADSGTFTTVSATQKVFADGKIAHVIGSVTITTNGSAAGGISVPVPPSVTFAGSVVAYGRETALTGKAISGSFSGGNVRFTNYDNTYPGASGAVLIFEYHGEIA